MSRAPPTFGDVLRQLRTAASLSQEDLAERAGVSLRGVSDLERGVRRAPYLHTVRALADALELSPADRQALLAAARPGSAVEVPAGARAGSASLPTPLTSLVGRERELAALVSLLGNAGVRLVTLTGAGGTGKTRLAIAVAERLAEHFPDGVWFVGLAPVTDPTLVVPSVAQVLGVREAGREPLTERLQAHLSNKHLLLVLDNFEQVVEAAPLVTDLLRTCSAVKVLVTSRVRLRVSGEHEYVVPPLGLAEPDAQTTIEGVRASAAVRLFVARAQAVREDFALTDENAAAVARICQRLDGLPLAIELAAPRIKVLPPSALLARLEPRLPLLTGGGRDAPARQRTMRDAIAWSYELLTVPEQALLRRLAVVVGGCTLEAAEAIANPTGACEIDVLDGVISLVDQSLLREEEGPDGEPRYLMLETVREFGLERLAESGDRELMRARHARYFAALAQRGAPGLYTTATAPARQFAAERPNVRAALAWELEQGTTDLLLRLAATKWWYLEPTDGFRTLEQALATTVEEPASRPGERAMLLAAMGELAAWLGDGARAVPLLEQCLVLAREAGHGTATALAQLWLSYTVAGEGELDRAKALATESLAWWRALAEPDWRRTGDALFALGYIASLRGHQHEAEARFTEGLVVARALGADISIAVGLESLGTCAREQGDQRRAAQLFAESLVLVRDGKDPFTIFTCLNSLGAVAAVTDRPEQAARLFGASEALRERHGVALLSADGLRLERAIAPARARLPEAAFAAAWADGRALPLEEAIAEALKVADDVAAPVLSEATAGQGSVQS